MCSNVDVPQATISIHRKNSTSILHLSITNTMNVRAHPYIRIICGPNRTCTNYKKRETCGKICSRHSLESTSRQNDLDHVVPVVGRLELIAHTMPAKVFITHSLQLLFSFFILRKTILVGFGFAPSGRSFDFSPDRPQFRHIHMRMQLPNPVYQRPNIKFIHFIHVLVHCWFSSFLHYVLNTFL